MIETIRKLFGLGPSADYRALMERGAVIVDVRTTGEFKQGHIRTSVNIPLDELHRRQNKLKKEQPVITCCASGIRSAQAKGMLKAKGFEVYNGGGWMSLQRKLALFANS